MEQWRKKFINRFAELKQTDGMTQASLAESLGLSQGTIAQWASGSRQPRNLAQYRALENALKLPAGTLTAPGIAETGTIYKAIENGQPYQPSLDVDAVEKALGVMMNTYGLDNMKDKGAAWSAKTIIMLYDLLTHPDTAALTPEQVSQFLKVTEKHQ